MTNLKVNKTIDHLKVKEEFLWKLPKQLLSCHFFSWNLAALSLLCCFFCYHFLGGFLPVLCLISAKEQNALSWTTNSGTQLRLHFSA